MPRSEQHTLNRRRSATESCHGRSLRFCVSFIELCLFRVQTMNACATTWRSAPGQITWPGLRAWVASGTRTALSQGCSILLALTLLIAPLASSLCCGAMVSCAAPMVVGHQYASGENAAAPQEVMEMDEGGEQQSKQQHPGNSATSGICLLGGCAILSSSSDVLSNFTLLKATAGADPLLLTVSVSPPSEPPRA